MEHCLFLVSLLVITTALASQELDQGNRTGRAFSLFSIVQFPNAGCTGSSSSTTSYIRNPNYPSSYTPSSTGSCTFTINKSTSDICQLRIDFQTMSGFAETDGVCSDKLATAGQTGKQPPTVCGTMTGYHMYTEFGTTSTDTITLTLTYGSTTTAKTWNLLLRQISCDATWKAPTDCVQYFTGSTGTIQSYNFAGGQLLQGMYYTNCIRTEAGYCGIQYKESTGQTPDTFDFFPNEATNAEASAGGCPVSFVYIPNLSSDGVSALGIPSSTESFISVSCGQVFGLDGTAVSLALTTRAQPFIVGVYTDTTTSLTSPTTGFSLDYTQVPC